MGYLQRWPLRRAQDKKCSIIMSLHRLSAGIHLKLMGVGRARIRLLDK